MLTREIFHEPGGVGSTATYLAGASVRRLWTPSLHFFRETIDLIGLMNLEEDHLSDFKNVMQDCTVPGILSNPTMGPREFAVLKKGSMGPGA